MMLTGIVLFTVALLALTFMLGRWNGERAAARAHVRNLEQQRHWLAEQRDALDEQRAALEQQRAHLDMRRRTERMPDSGRAPTPRPDDQPTVPIRRRPDLSGARWLDMPDHLNKRGHRARDDEQGR